MSIVTRYQLSAAETSSGGGSSSPAGSPVPEYAGARTGAWEAERSVYGRTAAGMRELRAKLGSAASATGLCRITMVGDSVTAGFSAQPGRTDPVMFLRNALRDAWFRVGGLVYAWNNTTPDTRWTWSGFTPSGDLSLPYLAGGSGSTATFTSDVAGSTVEILTTPVSARFTYSIDGASAVTIPAGTANQMQLITVTGLADTPHTVTITAAASGSSQIVAVGVVPTNGVALVNAGMSSSMTSQWLGDWYQGIDVALATNPDVVCIELGGNDCHNGVAVADYRDRLSDLVDAARGSGAAVFLVASHQGDADVLEHDNWLEYVSAIYDVADLMGCPLLDLSDRFGTYAETSVLGLAAGDGLHLNAAGYATKARALADLFSVPVAAPQQVIVGSAVRVHALGAGQTLTSGAPAPIDITTTEFNDDPSLYHVNLTDNVISVTRTGKYLVQWELKFDGGSNGQRFASFASLPDGTTLRESGFTGASGSTSAATPCRLTAGVTYCLAGYVDGGANVGVASDAVRATGWSLTYLGA